MKTDRSAPGQRVGSRWRSWPLLVLLPLALLGLNRGLWTADEPREAQIGREMLLSPGVIPTLDGHRFIEKPPLYYWALAGAYRIGGGPSAPVGVAPASSAIPDVAEPAGQANPPAITRMLWAAQVVLLIAYVLAPPVAAWVWRGAPSPLILLGLLIALAAAVVRRVSSLRQVSSPGQVPSPGQASGPLLAARALLATGATGAGTGAARVVADTACV